MRGLYLLRKKYSSIPLLRPPLILPKSGLISGVVLILNVEHSSRSGAFFFFFFFFFFFSKKKKKKKKTTKKKNVRIFFAILRRGASNESPQHYFQEK